MKRPMTDRVTPNDLLGLGRSSPWWCPACGYALLNGVEWGVHTEWHRRERARAAYAAADAEIEREFRTGSR